ELVTATVVSTAGVDLVAAERQPAHVS
ncbi:MAG: hypothetical protein QOE76_2241, partial [Frankiales bacterium]|nr:hypothetical protein [Frankiales bacterium]